MTTARDAILATIAAAVQDSPLRGRQLPRETTKASVTPRSEIVELFVERVTDYKATVTRCGPDEVASVVATLLAVAGSSTLLIPTGINSAWLPSTVTPVVDDALPYPAIESCSAVLTAAAHGIAETGTIVLDHAPDQGRRVISLLPDHHICVIRADQVVRSVPQAIVAIDSARPSTLISGPSATSDIELNRVEGVHGPRRLDVIILEQRPGSARSEPSPSGSSQTDRHCL